MNPVLYPKGSTSFSTLGKGTLGEAIHCYVDEKINDYFTLELAYPVNGEYADEFELDDIIAASVKGYSLRQLFRITRIERDQATITIHANHLSYQLNSIPVNTFTASSASSAMSGIKSNSATTNPFNFSSQITSSTQFSVETPMTARSALLGSGGVASTYGGELLFNNYNVTLVTRRGGTSDSNLLYGKNIVSLKRDISADDLCTGLLGYYKKDDTVVTANVVTTSTVSNYAYSRIAIVDLSSEFDSTPTVAQLTTKAQEKLNGMGVGSHIDSVSVDPIFVNLYYDDVPEQIEIGDSIDVNYEPMGVAYTARITAYQWDVIMERYTSVVVGKESESLADYIVSGGSTSVAAGGSGGGGATIVIDSAMSDTSQNAVMNRTIKLYVDGLAGTKVDKETGKGLSTNDFNNALLTKLNGIATGAEVNVQSNWAETDSTSDAYIQNKPTIPTVNNGTLTINVNGTGVGTFSANQSSDTTANITVPTKTSELTNDSGYVSGVDHASATNWGTVTFTSNEPGVGYSTIGYSSGGSNVTSNLAKVDSSTNTISGNILPAPTTSVRGGVTINYESDGSLSIDGNKVAPLVAPSNKISPDFLPDVDKWNGVSLTMSNTGAGNKYVPVLSSTSATTANLSKTTTSPNDIGHIPVYDGDGWLYANTIDSSADGKAVANKTYVDTKVSSISVPTKTSDLTNDSGFITSSALPTKTSDLTNDSGFLTQVTSSNVTQALGYLPVKNIKDSEGNYFTKNSSAEVTLTGATTSNYGLVKVDDTMSDSSTNPVQNSVIKSYIDSHEGDKTWYGECSTASSTSTKTVTIDGFPSTLYAGLQVSIKFTNSNSISGTTTPTLRINGGTAVTIVRYGTTTAGSSSDTSWNAGAVVNMVYDGTYWVITNWVNSVYSVISQGGIEGSGNVVSGLITGQRFTQGFEARISNYHDSTKQDLANLVTSVSSSSTDTQYPSAKCLYDLVGDIETLLTSI